MGPARWWKLAAKDFSSIVAAKESAEIFDDECGARGGQGETPD